MLTTKHLQLEVTRLRQENTQLRKALRLNGRHARRIQRAYDCALLLATWHVGELSTTRDYAASQGMAQRQWENGFTLLKFAKVCDQDGRFRVHTLVEIEPLLVEAAVRANAVPDAFFAYGNNHMRQ